MLACTFHSHFFSTLMNNKLTALLFLSIHLFYAQTFYAQEKITLLFAGDLMQHQAQIDAARTDSGYNYEECFKYVRDEIQSADIAIANLEVTLGGKPYSGYPRFSAPDEYLHAIKEAGFDVLLTANNHCLDTGKEGLERTYAQLDAARIRHAGTYPDSTARHEQYPLCIRKNGFTIIILNYTYGTNGIEEQRPNVVNRIDKRTIQQDIRQAKAFRPDAIIACMHWGIEYKFLPEQETREMADWLLEQGVTHIIGGHPHVVQPIEVRNNPYHPDQNVVVYSLGNYLSNMSAQGTDGGIMVKLELTKAQGITRLSHCSYSLVWTSRPAISKNKNFILYPANANPELLSPEEQQRMNTFINDTRELMHTHNKGAINEYSLQ